jgi:hypothetical protein
MADGSISELFWMELIWYLKFKRLLTGSRKYPKTGCLSGDGYEMKLV